MDSLAISQSDNSTNFSNWASKFISVFDKHAPISYKRMKRDTQLDWFNDDIKFAIKQRDKFHSRKDWNQYKYWRNKLTVLLRISKRNFFSRSIEESKDNTFLWRHIKNLSGQNIDRKILDEIVIDDNTHRDKNDVIEQLNYFFTTISDRLKSNDTQNHDTVNYDFKKLKDYVDSKIRSEISFMKSSELPSNLLILKNLLDWTAFRTKFLSVPLES